VKNEYFLLLVILAFRLADGLTSYFPARGLVYGLGEGNPVAVLAIERWGFFWAFVFMLLLSMGFVLAFVAATHLEEIRMAARTDYNGIQKVRTFRLVGLAIFIFLSSIPVINNLAVASGI